MENHPEEEIKTEQINDIENDDNDYSEADMLGGEGIWHSRPINEIAERIRKYPAPANKRSLRRYKSLLY